MKKLNLSKEVKADLHDAAKFSNFAQMLKYTFWKEIQDLPKHGSMMDSDCLDRLALKMWEYIKKDIKPRSDDDGYGEELKKNGNN